jgi:hypothetical protein
MTPNTPVTLVGKSKLAVLPHASDTISTTTLPAIEALEQCRYQEGLHDAFAEAEQERQRLSRIPIGRSLSIVLIFPLVWSMGAAFQEQGIARLLFGLAALNMAALICFLDARWKRTPRALAQHRVQRAMTRWLGLPPSQDDLH